MHRPNFCAECGERLARRGWRGWINPQFCSDCAQRLGGSGLLKPIAVLSIVAVSAFAFGRYARPPAPPLVIQRAANSPLSDLTANLHDSARTTRLNPANPAMAAPNADEPGYICGARTKKGTPCHRRVHVAGERCFQHKGMPSLLPLSKLVVGS